MTNNIKITSFDAADCGTFGDVLTSSHSREKPRVGFLGLGYFEYWRMYPALRDIVAADLDKVFSRLKEALPEFDVIYPGMVDTLDRAEEAGAMMATACVSAIIIVEGTYIPDFITIHVINRTGTNPHLILFSSQTNLDLSPNDKYMDTMRNSALIGITQLTGSFNKMKLSYDALAGEISDPSIYHEINSILTAYAAVKKLRSSTYGLIGQVFRGMYDLEFDRAKVKGFLGPEVMTIQPDHLVDCWKMIEDGAVTDLAKSLMRRFKVRKVDLEDVKRSCRVALAMKQLYRKFNLDGLCFLGQHFIEKMTGAPARMGASLMMEQERNMVACEGDVGGLVMMQLMNEFTGNIPFQAEWGQFDLKNNALFLLGHGIAVPEQAASDTHVTLTCSPEEWGFKGSGLNYEMILKPGHVTMGHFLNTGDSWQMLVSSGESIDFPCLPCDEIHAMIRVESPVRSYLREILKTGTAHHLIVVHGDAEAELQKAAEFMRIKTVSVK